MAGGDLGVEHLVAPPEIVAPEDRREQLLAGAGDAAEGDRALGPDQIAVLPAQFEPHPFAGAVARLAGDGAHRRRLERDGEIDDVAAFARDRADIDGRDQAGRDQRLAQILDPLGAERLALAEAGDGLDMAGAEQGPALDQDMAEAARAGGLDGEDQGRGAAVMIDDHLGLADPGEGEAAPAELGPERRFRLAHPHRVDRVMRGNPERAAQAPRHPRPPPPRGRAGSPR